MRRHPVLALAMLAALAAVALVAGLAVNGGADASPAAAHPGVKPRPKPPRELLFAHDADAGSLVRVAGSTKLFDLKLTGVHPSALYFADRPSRLVGATPLAHMLAGFFAKPGRADLPNAAINAIDPRTGKQVLMGAELLSARYSPKSATLTYRIRSLPQGPPDMQEHGRTDVVLPRTLGQTSVFVDDSYRYCSVQLSNDTDATLTLTADSKYSHDDWTTEPKNARVGDDPVNAGGVMNPSTYLNWGSESGFDRGCANSATFALRGFGTVTISVADPWSGSNSYSCTWTGVPGIKCLRVSNSYGNPVWGGDQLSAQYDLCMVSGYSTGAKDGAAGVDCDTHIAQGDLLP